MKNEIKELREKFNKLKQRLLNAILFTAGRKKCCDSLPEINKVFDILIKEITKYERDRIKEKVERIKLDMDVIVCECGEPYKKSDPADLINKLLKELNK